VEVGEDTLSSVGELSSLAGSSVSKYLSDSESGSESEEEETEPQLKYERLSQDLKTILRKDVASCLAVHSRFLLLGSHWGVVHLLDALGNSLPSRQLQAHTITVNQVSVDHAGEFYASCSDDGRVVITGLYSDDHTVDTSLDRPVTSVAIDPIYARKDSGRRFMTGAEDQVVLHEKVLFGRYKQEVLCQGEGQVGSIKWRGRFAAWTTSKGVRVHDVVEGKTISLIQRPASCTPSKEVPWRIAWSDQFHLMVSFGDQVKVCVVKKRGGRVEGLPEFCVEVSGSFCLDCWVCGLAPLEALIVVLAIPKERDQAGRRQRPQLMVFDPSDEFRLLSTDLLAVRGHEEHGPSHYQLEHLVEDRNYFVLSPKDVVVGKPRDEDDHVEWLLQHHRFQQALQQAKDQAKLLKRFTPLGVGRQYLDHLLAAQEFQAAAQLCPSILGTNRALWQQEVFKFAQQQQVQAVAGHLPCTLDTRLEPAIYEMVLLDFLRTDEPGFLELVRRWPPQLYSTAAVVHSLIERLLTCPDNTTLLRALATLYSHQRKYDKAVAMYLKLGHPDVFSLIRQHRLFRAIEDKVQALLELDQEQALQLLLDFPQELPPPLVAAKLAGSGRRLFLYLDRLYGQDRSLLPKEYHGTLVRLYADFAPHKLLHFLKVSDEYPMAEALAECELRGLTPERIYLLARVGSTKAALQLIMRELVDVEQAVAFCKEQEDPELWEDLIRCSLDKPPFIIVLLNSVGTHIDPRQLVERIEPGLEIPGLRDSLIQILRDYNLQVSLQEGCKRILVSDCYSLLTRRVRAASRGLLVSPETCCPECGGAVCAPGGEEGEEVVVLACRHTFHSSCLPGPQPACSVCNKGGPGARGHTSTYYYRDN